MQFIINITAYVIRVMPIIYSLNILKGIERIFVKFDMLKLTPIMQENISFMSISASW